MPIGGSEDEKSAQKKANGGAKQTSENPKNGKSDFGGTKNQARSTDLTPLSIQNKEKNPTKTSEGENSGNKISERDLELKMQKQENGNISTSSQFSDSEYEHTVSTSSLNVGHNGKEGKVGGKDTQSQKSRLSRHFPKHLAEETSDDELIFKVPLTNRKQRRRARLVKYEVAPKGNSIMTSAGPITEEKVSLELLNKEEARIWGSETQTDRDKAHEKPENITFEEYKEMEKTQRDCNQTNKIKEIELDLFELPDNYSLGHCVAADFQMSGLAQLKRPGGKGNNFIYHLVTKNDSADKPEYKDLWNSLKKLEEHTRIHKVRDLAMPRIGRNDHKQTRREEDKSKNAGNKINIYGENPEKIEKWESAYGKVNDLTQSPLDALLEIANKGAAIPTTKPPFDELDEEKKFVIAESRRQKAEHEARKAELEAEKARGKTPKKPKAGH
ncbi:hypothetical protein JTB14_018768 [Gonioctena quinquepunctata]|nr:hypothetical protein JTB14_018768 [Gonioctena quinquepunctata]